MAVLYCLSEHDFTFYSNLDSTAEDVEFENVNPIDTLLGEGGVVEKCDHRDIRPASQSA